MYQKILKTLTIIFDQNALTKNQKLLPEKFVCVPGTPFHPFSLIGT